MANVKNGTLQSAIDNAAVGETIMLTEDIVLTSRMTVSNVVTIDLNGYTITGNIDDGYGAVYVGTKGVLTIKDSSSGKAGCITNTIGNAIGNYGIVNIYGGTFTGNYALYNFYYSDSVYGTSTIYGGTFKPVGGESPAIANCGDLTVSGGTIDSIDTTNTLTVNDGAVRSLFVGVADYAPKKQSTSINGGHISDISTADGSVNKVTVYGGVFDTAIDAKYLAEGVEFTYDENTGTYVATASHGLRVIATSSSRIKDLVIKDGQLIFVQDLGRIAFDFKGKRVFYNQIVALPTEADRLDLESPLNGYYFVIDRAVLWQYQDGWIQITEEPEEVLFIGVELPELGKARTLYVDKEEREISVWDEDTCSYIAVSNYTDDVTVTDIENLFK